MSVTVSDAGTHFIVSASTREAVESELKRLVGAGATVRSEPALIGAKWMATFENRRLTVRVNVEKLGMKSILTAPTREAVEAKIAELVERGSRVDQPLEEMDGVWTAVLDDAA
jgi:ribosome-associated translation inhibitor RaiA